PAVRDTPVAVPLCSGCRERDAHIAELQQHLAAALAQNRKLEESVRRNASNSSIPPSTLPRTLPSQPPKNQPAVNAVGNRDMPAIYAFVCRLSVSSTRFPWCPFTAITVR